jgi:hypothetical protein
VEVDDLHYEQVLRAEKNIHTVPDHHVCVRGKQDGDRADRRMDLDTHAVSQTRDHRPSLCRLYRFTATLGALAGAEWVIGAGPVADGQRRRENHYERG